MDTDKPVKPSGISEELYKRFRSKFIVKKNGCWHWGASRSKNGRGYGYFSLDKVRMAHRVAYEWWVGPIPEGLQLDHLCRNMACVNPKHLEPVTLHENNVVRGIGLAAQNAKKTHCPRGHEYDGINSMGRRVCKTCLRENLRRSRAERRARGIKC